MRGASGMCSIDIPVRWEAAAFFGRLVTEGIYSIEQLSSPQTKMRNVFLAMRMLDIENYFELTAMEKARKANGH